MAVTVSLYNHTAKLFANGEVSLADLKFMLLDGTTSFSAAHTTIAQASDTGADEVDGNGWTTGGEALASAAVTVTTTNDAKLDADDLGHGIERADFCTRCVIYDSDSGNVIAHVDFGETVTATDGGDFDVVWHANGIITWSVT